MKITKTHGLLLGLSLLGGTAALSALQPAQAAPEVIRSQFRPNRPGRNWNTQTITGRVTRNYPGNGFLLRTDRGSTYHVTVAGGEPRRLNVGDRLRLEGSYRGDSFRAQNWWFIRNR